MYDFRLGVIVESFKLEMREAIQKAAFLGAKGLQMYATRGDYTPENLSASGRKELLDFVKSNGFRSVRGFR